MKPDIVLLHGWASHPSVWRTFTSQLEPAARVHVLALPGYAGMPVSNPYTLARMAAMLATMAPKSCTVVGWSLGAQVALAWAQRAPAQVSRLVLMAGTPCFAQRTGWAQGTAPMKLREFTSMLERDAEALLRRFVALQSSGDRQAVRVAHKLRTALFTNTPPQGEALRAGLEILRSADLRDELGSIKQPALVIHGEHDKVTPAAAGRFLAEHLPKARYEGLPDAGHAPFLSANEHVARLVLDFARE